MWWNILVSLLLLSLSLTTNCERMNCSPSEYERCVTIADPLVKEAHLIFPDNLDDIDLVCRTWNRFVDCLKAYTEDCFTETQRRQFNRAVESPIESVHEMCMQPSYQKEYLRYASCIKSTVIERDHCGPHYNLLVEQVEQGDVISKSTLCCSHDRFKTCVQRETRRLCDQGIPDGPANRFATQTIDKALRFLQDQCLNYIPTSSAECTPLLSAATSYSDRSFEPKNVIPASSEVYPWSTIQQTLNEKGYEKSKQEDEQNSHASRVPKVSTSTSWLPSSTKNDQEQNPSPHLGARGRPSSYGRASSWPTESSSTTARSTQSYASNFQTTGHQNIPKKSNSQGVTSTNTLSQDYGSEQKLEAVPSLSEGGSSSTPFTNKWGTIEAVANPGSNSKSSAPSTTPTPTQRSVGSGSSTQTTFTTPAWYPTSSPETWYPAAGFQLNNEVDEPNQMGLIKPKNKATTSPRSSCLLVAASFVGYLWLYRV